MTFSEWQELAPDVAAREVHKRVESRLNPAQRRAVIAWLRDDAALTALFSTVRRGPDRPLAGVPYFAKDLFDVASAPTLAGATFLTEVRPAPRTDGTLIRAARQTGLVCAGKTHLHEFAYGITGENPHYGDCEHPRFAGRTTGGSSSGSAAVVAAGVAPIAFGTDTGGSIRVPAAFCGLFGLRLSPGDAWIRDAFPLSPSFDTAGWFTANAGDMRGAISALIGLQHSERPLRGCYVELPGLDPEVAEACRRHVAELGVETDATTESDLLSGFAPTLDCYNTIVARDAWAVHAGWAETYRNEYDPAVRQRLLRGQTLTRDQIAGAENTRAAVRVLWTKFFLAYDFLVLPATPFGALTKAGCTVENRGRLLTLTAPASVGGLPVLTIPTPLPSGLTTGLQIVVNHARSPVLSWALKRVEEEARGVGV